MRENARNRGGLCISAMVAVTIGLSIGCSSVKSLNEGTLTPAGEKVRITSNTQDTAGCKWVGEVKGNRVNSLRNDAAVFGANLLWVDSAQRNPFFVFGQAYRCEAPPPATPPVVE